MRGPTVAVYTHMEIIRRSLMSLCPDADMSILWRSLSVSLYCPDIEISVSVCVSFRPIYGDDLCFCLPVSPLCPYGDICICLSVSLSFYAHIQYGDLFACDFLGRV